MFLIRTGVKRKIMKKRVLAFVLAVSVMSTGIPVFAKEGTTSTTEESDVIIKMDDSEIKTKEDTTTKSSTSKNSTSKEEDFVYAKVTYKGIDYAINKSDYDSFIGELQEIGTKKEFFYPTTKVVEDFGNSVSVEEEEDVYIPYLYKDTGYPFEEWPDYVWADYNNFKQTFKPTEWQSIILQYYTLQEYYAYYMGFGYYIDEAAVKQRYEAEQKVKTKSQVKVKTSTSVVEVQEDYATVTVQFNLDSMYEKKQDYCVTASKYSDLKALLSNYNKYEDNKTSVDDPNVYVEGSYHIEIGTMDEYMSSYTIKDKEKVSKIVSFLKKNKIDEEKADEDCYKVRIRTKIDSKNIEKVFIISSPAFMKLVENYLGSTEVNIEEMGKIVADEAKG